MVTTYHYKRGMMLLGPYRVERIRDLVRQAEIGRAHQISIDGGVTWRPAEEFPELFQYEEPEVAPSVSASPPVEVPRQGLVPSQDDDDDDDEDAVLHNEKRPRRRRKKRKKSSQGVSYKSKSASTNPYAVSGFICSLVAAILLAIPCLVWVFIAQSFFWIFNIVIPLGVLAVLGLTLSVIALRTTRNGLSTAGAVLGVIALVMTTMAIIGSSTIRYRMATLRRVQIDSWAADIELSRKDLAEALSAFRNQQKDPNESDSQFAEREAALLQNVAAHLGMLASKHDGHLTATASTSEFRAAFEDGLPSLRKSVLEVQQAAEQIGLDLSQLLPSVNANTEQLKLLMDTLNLFEKGRLTLRQVEGKMTGK